MNNQVISLTTQGDLAHLNDIYLTKLFAYRKNTQAIDISLVLPTHFFVYILCFVPFLIYEFILLSCLLIFVIYIVVRINSN